MHSNTRPGPLDLLQMQYPERALYCSTPDIHTEKHTQAHTHAHPLALFLTHTHARAHTRSPSRSFSHIHAICRSLSLALSHTHTQLLSLSIISHTDTHIVGVSMLCISLRYCGCITDENSFDPFSPAAGTVSAAPCLNDRFDSA